MKAISGFVGQFRIFTCEVCGVSFEKFYCHFEFAEKFFMSECINCRRPAHLKETPKIAGKKFGWAA